MNQNDDIFIVILSFSHLLPENSFEICEIILEKMKQLLYHERNKFLTRETIFNLKRTFFSLKRTFFMVKKNIF